ncbi:MAG: ParA family protein [Epsilonproteobacteria bacterium]|nr:ParA family protein [Campylobacterota bacterium]
MITILITNRKGGVGKTTTTLSIAAEFAQRGYKTLLIDLDTQGHIQYGLGIKHDFEYGIHKAIQKEDIDIKLIVQKSKMKNLYFIPANINYNSSLLQNKKTLKKLLRKVKDEYDFCIIDTAPMSDTVLEMAILASDYVIVPMKTEYLGLVGTVQFVKIFYKIASRLKTDFKLLGVLPTFYSKSIKEHKETIDKLASIIGKDKILPPIRKDIKLTHIFKNGLKSIAKEHSRGKDDYTLVVDEILKKL